MLAANKLLHLLEAFSTTWFLFSAAQNHHLVFFLLEAFNNIIQYQFDGETRPEPWPGLRGGNQDGQCIGTPSCPPEEGRTLCSPPPPFIQRAFIEHLLHTKPVLGAGHTGGSNAQCSLPRAAHSWGCRHRGRP